MPRALPLAASPGDAFLGANSPFAAGEGTCLFAGDPSFAILSELLNRSKNLPGFLVGRRLNGMLGHPAGFAVSRSSVSLGVTGGVQQLLLQVPRSVRRWGPEQCCLRAKAGNSHWEDSSLFSLWQFLTRLTFPGSLTWKKSHCNPSTGDNTAIHFFFSFL